MRKAIVQFALVVMIISMVWISGVRAATIIANSCSQIHVQAAINSASTGDVVVVPQGECTWSTKVSIPNNKKIILIGAGIESTVITRSSPSVAISMGQSGSRLTKFGFINGGVMVDGDGWRVDHCKFHNESFFSSVEVRGTRANGDHPTGLVDHCVFHNARVVIIGTAATFSDGDHQHILWSQPLNLGLSNDAVYVEDCEFTANVFSNAVDCNYGGAYVFRYNTVDHPYIECHSVQGNNRATRRWEVYGNIINNTGDYMYMPFRLRGGTGTVFYNSIIGNWTFNKIALDNVRSYTGDVNDNTTGNGRCDGDSVWDGNEDATGYPCRDQIGRGPDSPQWIYSPAGADTQPLIPAYAWINRKEANAEVRFGVINSCGDHIQANRDFYNYDAFFNGSSGMGAGTLANRPHTCTDGVGYWATEQSCSDLTGMVGPDPTTPISGTLYKCTDTNTWTEYFTPYSYPHPLSKPSPTQNVRTTN